MLPSFLHHLDPLHVQQEESAYLYDMDAIHQQCSLIQQFHSSKFQARYALKANPKKEILDIIRQHDIWIDACSEPEVFYALSQGFTPHQIQLSAQQSPKNWSKINSIGVSCIATSLTQLEDFCKSCPSSTLGVRINPGQGSGQFQQINTGGITSSFGIRHRYIPEIFEISNRYKTKITTLHIHIGSGADTQQRVKTLEYCLELCSQFPDLEVLNMGGGFKIARMPGEKQTDMHAILAGALSSLEAYNKKEQRQIKLEIEPGSFYVAQHGYILCRADDIVDTGSEGYRFVRTTTGMDMILRPALYNAQHPIYHLSRESGLRSSSGDHHYSFVGHCCESTDLLTPNPDGTIGTRGFDQEITRGDILIIGGCGAYCESMRCRGYNGFNL